MSVVVRTDVVFVAVELPANSETGGGGPEGGGSFITNFLAMICGTACKDTPLAEAFAPATGTVQHINAYCFLYTYISTIMLSFLHMCKICSCLCNCYFCL